MHKCTFVMKKKPMYQERITVLDIGKIQKKIEIKEAEEEFFDKTDKSFKTDEWEERLHRALFTREEWEKVLNAMDEIYNTEREARKKAYIRKKALEDRNIEFIIPKETMHVDPIPDENIHTIDFAHGYDYCKNVIKKEIHKLFEDTMNGTAGEFTRGWNLALKKC